MKEFSFWGELSLFVHESDWMCSQVNLSQLEWIEWIEMLNKTKQKKLVEICLKVAFNS